MQESLFDDDERDKASISPKPGRDVKPVVPSPDIAAVAQTLPNCIRLGTSSWHYPGWAGLVWDGIYSESTLSRHGLTAYAQHPLLRTVSIDRGFYRPLTVGQYAQYAAQVPEDFRFVVKAPSIVTDASVRDEAGRGMRINAQFLRVADALNLFVEPALEGLGPKLGALVFQISPLPVNWLADVPRLVGQMRNLLEAIPDLKRYAPDAVVAVEVRDAQWLRPDFVEALRSNRATYCMGLHAKMPRIAEQLPILRALWPGPLVCRWNLNPLHGAYGYEDAKNQYSPFNKMVDPDIETREALTRVIAGTAGAGQNVFVTLSNKAEGSAPWSVIELARAIAQAK
jgi:uncharacterized protein YecE (DUF72 family)